jgi:tetratricopeptide (TPR) repeat protein
MRRGEEIVEAYRPALELDPLNPVIAGHRSLMLFYAGRNDEAGLAAREAQGLFPDYWFPHYMISYVAWRNRDANAAISHMEKANQMTGGDVPWINCALAAIYYSFGRVDDGDRWLAKVETLGETVYVTTFGRAMIECARKNTEAAISWLERAHDEHDTLFVWARAFGELMGIIDDDEIRRAMERLDLL